jgi:hypothetical protein
MDMTVLGVPLTTAPAVTLSISLSLIAFGAVDVAFSAVLSFEAIHSCQVIRCRPRRL